MSRHANGTTATLAAALVTAVIASASGPVNAGSQAESNKRSAPSSARAATVFVVHALPKTPVSVQVDGAERRSEVQPGTVIGPLRLAPGSHTVTISGSDPAWVMDADVTVRAGRSADVVLHRPASVGGKPTVTVYRNPTGPVARGKGRVMVAQTATVPPADVRVDGRVVFANIANGEFATAEVPTGSHQVSIVPTGLRQPVLLGPIELTAQPATLTQVFAVGRPQNGSMDVIVQTQPLDTRGSTAPERMNTGSAGLATGPTFEVTAAPGTAAPSEVRDRQPTRVRLPGGQTIPVRPSGTGRGGLLQVPRNIRVAGWWDGGARLGDAYGAMVIAGHVDSVSQGVGPFAQLLGVRPGDRVDVGARSGWQRFVVTAVDLVPKVSLPTKTNLFDTSGPLRLVLITCAGSYDPDRGGYQDLAVVTARPTQR